ncbi:hypothetical protein NLI96_g4239 [Meripilus lineatus]|uniref:DNA topoisomerase n=1 Tax=Meripilus lineatus TaxID=2056292 RepID=A0AAD5YFW5_9APHY|nr:hypothetical protein NLI96_g4239 [Physisporinus lineatus]
MKKILCVAEKPSISKAITQILSGGQYHTRNTTTNFIKNYDFDYPQAEAHFTVTAVAGHIMEHDFGPEHGWKACDPFALFEAHIYAKVTRRVRSPSPGTFDRRPGGSQQVMIWTDCDREGENIAIRQIHRAAQHPVDLDMAQAQAVEARILLDLRIGAAFTRLQTLTLQGQFAQLDKAMISKIRGNSQQTSATHDRRASKSGFSAAQDLAEEDSGEVFDPQFDFMTLIDKQTADGAWGAFATGLQNGNFEQPRRGKNNDKAHPPIHPTAHCHNLQGDEKKVYDYITRRFLACCSKDAQGMETTVRLRMGDETFHTTGLRILQRNFLEVYPYEKWSNKELPEYREGQEFEPTACLLKSGMTTRPALLTEADLVGLMDKNGIGTDATIAQHIQTILDRSYVIGRMHGATKYLVPSTLGIGLVEGYDRVGFERSLSGPLLRRQTERQIVQVCERQKTKAEMLIENVERYKEIYMKTRAQMPQITQVRPSYHFGHLEVSTHFQSVREYLGNDPVGFPPDFLDDLPPGEGDDDDGGGGGGGGGGRGRGGRGGGRGGRGSRGGGAGRGTTSRRGRGGSTAPRSRRDDDDPDPPASRSVVPAKRPPPSAPGPSRQPAKQARTASTIDRSRSASAAPSYSRTTPSGSNSTASGSNAGKKYWRCANNRAAARCKFQQVVWDERDVEGVPVVDSGYNRPQSRTAAPPRRNTTNGAQGTRGDDVCFKCDKVGHWASECPGAPSGTRQKVASTSGTGGGGNGGCFHCGEVGHFASACPSKGAGTSTAVATTVVCFKCGKQGHYSNSCTSASTTTANRSTSVRRNGSSSSGGTRGKRGRGRGAMFRSKRFQEEEEEDDI